MTSILKINLIKLTDLNVRYINHVRHYARWAHRRPRRVLSSEECEETERGPEKISNNEKHQLRQQNQKNTSELNASILKQNLNHEHKSNEFIWIPKTVKSQLGPEFIAKIEKNSEPVQFKIQPTKKKVSYKTKEDVNKSTDMLETVVDANGDLIYSKLPDKDLAISKLMITVKSRKEQTKQNLILLEGKRLIKEALDAKCQLKNLIFSRKTDVEFLKPYLPKSGAKLYKIPYREIQLWSNLTTTPGIMGIFKTPEVDAYVPSKNSLPLTVICDNVREPGNLGAILRTAAAVGVQNVLLTKGCVDLWDTKVLRSSCGAHFHVQIRNKMEWSDIRDSLKDLNVTALIADNSIVTETIENPNKSLEDEENKTDTKNLKDIITEMPLLCYYSLDFSVSNHLVLIVGGETEGISDNSYRFAADYNGVRLNIPMNNDIESLNTGTALGIIAFEIKKQFLHSRSSVNIENN